MGLINNKENKGDNMNSVKVTVNGNIMEVTNGTSLEELVKKEYISQKQKERYEKLPQK